MKFRFSLILFIFFVLASLAWKLRYSSNKQPQTQKSPLAFANKIVPDLMGVKKPNSDKMKTPDESRRTQEALLFRNYLQTSYIRLPTIEAVRLSRDGEFHQVPPEVLESSEIFGEIADKIKSNPSLIKDALRFYNACTHNEQLLSSIRAVCARNFIDWAKEGRVDISQVEIPERILQIAGTLPSRN